MTEHSHSPDNFDRQPPAYVPYEPYPEEHARRMVTVRRTGGELDGGWLIDGEVLDASGVEKYVLIKLREDGAAMEKRVSKQQINELQNQLHSRPEAVTRDRKVSEGLSHAAVTPNVMIELPDRAAMSVDDKVALGWAVSHDELEHSNTEAEKRETDKARERLEQLFGMPDPSGHDRYGGSFRSRASVTEQSTRDAAELFRYAKVDENIKELFDKFKGNAWREDDMPEVLRTNQELRIELGEYLLEKLDTLEWLPERVAINSAENTKSPNFPGYGDLRLTSREYAAMLAVSMLDGTFDAQRSLSDIIEKNMYGEVIRGQHRYAAHMALGTERRADVTRT